MLCQDGFCAVEKNSEGHDICTITGMCVKMLSFSNEEFVDTACVLGEEDAPQAHKSPAHDAPCQEEAENSGADDAFSTSCARGKRPAACPDDTQRPAKQAKPADAAACSRASLRPAAPPATGNVCSVNKKNRYGTRDQ